MNFTILGFQRERIRNGMLNIDAIKLGESTCEMTVTISKKVVSPVLK